MSREERRRGHYQQNWLLALDLLFYPWLLALFLLPLLYICPHLPVLQSWLLPEEQAEVRPVQAPDIVPADLVYLTVQLLEPSGARVQVLLSGVVVGRFLENTLDITAMRGELLELDARSELREVRLCISSSTAQYPVSGQEYVLLQEIQPLVVR